MDLGRRKHLAGILPRSSTKRTAHSELIPTGSGFSTYEESDDIKGPLGLSTLYDPSPPSVVVADIVFIHGLGGGSRKTWSYSTDIRHFWPQKWLPADPDFRDVRVHSFGYKADWAERGTRTLDIHDFGQSLLSALKNDPSVRRDISSIILVGHSMGGCVAKKAYVLARQDPTCKDLARRMHSIFFLGTPHRGSDLAPILEGIMIAGFGKKPYVTDLVPNSQALAQINDSFRHVAPDLRLWSFYETLPHKVGVMNRIVVEKHSATLGYHNEEIAAMNADHRQVCKFDSQADPNYQMLRNALHTAVDMTRVAPLAISPLRSRVDSTLSVGPNHPAAEARNRLEAFMGVGDNLESELTILRGLKDPGSCSWFSEKLEFRAWHEGDEASILWLIGKPASGKSVIACHVIDELKPPFAYCSYFYFKHGVDGRSTLSDCFRSLAFQMAMKDSAVREKLLQLEIEGVIWDKSDEASVWRRLFTNCIFKISSSSHHFWVIDGLDECANYNALFTKKLLAATPRDIRVFITSRSLEPIERGIASLGSRVQTAALSDDDTHDDMRRFLSTKLKDLDRLETEEENDAMCEKIMQKSAGSFLWVRLVLQELESAWTEEDMESVLHEVPSGLHDLYLRMLHSIEQDPRKKMLARCILTWVVLASRPLTLEELRCIIKLELNQKVQNIVKAIPSLCGHLVYIDEDERVHMLHETTREFLLDETHASELAVNKHEAHGRLACVLLQYLSGEVMKPQQPAEQNGLKARGFGKLSISKTVDDSLLDYAATFFSEHVYRCSSINDNIMEDLRVFLSSNVLSWIEHHAKKGDLSGITRTGINLRAYLTRRVKYVPPTDPSIHLVDDWVTDLIRVAAKFRTQLLMFPSSIHNLIPPLCPSGSIIARNFTQNRRSSTVTVKGLPVGTWDDCLSRMDFQKGQAVAITYGERTFAVGLSTGRILLYDHQSLQYLLDLLHPERVKIIKFSPDDQYLASAGNKHLLVWEPKSGAKIYSFPLLSPLLGIISIGTEEFLSVSQSSELTKWNLDAGDHDSISWKTGQNSTDASELFTDILPDQMPVATAFTIVNEVVLLAVGYRQHPILMWNALELDLLGRCTIDGNNGIDDMVFNPNPEIQALVVSYNDGRLCVFDYVSMAVAYVLPNVFAQTVACSPDGQTLITGSSRGTLELFEFDQSYDESIVLIPMYRINAVEDSIRGVAFSADGLRFVDVHGRHCRAWEPTVLVRKNTEMESISDAMSLISRENGSQDSSEEPDITSPLAISADGRCVVAGNSAGNVLLFWADDANLVGTLCSHGRGASVVAVALGETRDRIISADDSGRVLVTELAMPLSNVAATARLSEQKFPASRTILDRRFDGSVTRLLVDSSADRLLVNNRVTDELWDLSSGSTLGIPTVDAISGAMESSDLNNEAGANGAEMNAFVAVRSTFQHPDNAEWFVTIEGGIVHIFAWSDGNEVMSSSGIRLEQQPVKTADSISATQAALVSSRPTILHRSFSLGYCVGSGFIIELVKPSPTSQAHLQAWPAAMLDPSSSSSVPPSSEPLLEAVGPIVATVLGWVGATTLVFLDVNMWVCSITLQSVPHALRTRSGSAASAQTEVPPGLPVRYHFFALSEWRSAAGDIQCALAAEPSAMPRTVGWNVVFATGSRIVVVKGGLETSRTIDLSASATS